MDYKCLMDTNLVMDLILGRGRSRSLVVDILPNYEEVFISAKTFSTVFYLLRKYEFSKESIFNDLELYKILPTTSEICLQGYKWAKNSQDVEDCMELALAFYHNCTFITADQKLFQNYSEIVEIKFVQ